MYIYIYDDLHANVHPCACPSTCCQYLTRHVACTCSSHPSVAVELPHTPTPHALSIEVLCAGNGTGCMRSATVLYRARCSHSVNLPHTHTHEFSLSISLALSLPRASSLSLAYELCPSFTYTRTHVTQPTHMSSNHPPTHPPPTPSAYMSMHE